MWGMKTYSMDLRTRIVQAVDRRVGSQGEVASLFGVSRTFVKNPLRQRRDTSSVAPKPPGGHRPKLQAEKCEAVRSYILDVKNDASCSRSTDVCGAAVEGRQEMPNGSCCVSDD